MSCFYPLEIIGRDSEIQLQVGENIFLVDMIHTRSPLPSSNNNNNNNNNNNGLSDIEVITEVN